MFQESKNQVEARAVVSVPHNAAVLALVVSPASLDPLPPAEGQNLPLALHSLYITPSYLHRFSSLLQILRTVFCSGVPL
ncbi:MAG: hypothetical protein QXM99_07205, partial [Thermofilum sp.]